MNEIVFLHPFQCIVKLRWDSNLQRDGKKRTISL